MVITYPMSYIVSLGKRLAKVMLKTGLHKIGNNILESTAKHFSANSLSALHLRFFLNKLYEFKTL